ncbi:MULTISPECIES: type II toxin-antitoxin system HipA family toxin [Arthrobacter]|uniref:Type II toxin-antitoxin system HipA family toxin n=1 Tax=Arthrobacter terricola TaxID=2547396 RepID=A0A4R5KRC0_9MICC|nr:MULTISPECIES: HipA domain-containing protein [Arthrobacter]MBT8160921.1 HipA domain-containing protein [Arthrobacter sp. GN70]TDF97330.1 type II toxin-antitoxin system HipA family toxin [Arthrobacter terricola]
MSAQRTLDVFLRGRRIGELKGSGLRLSFQYDREVLAEYGAGSILLSLSLPLNRSRIDGAQVYNFFDGLLPEGQVRSHLARENGLAAPDAFGLLRVLGSECAGAVQVLTPGETPERHGDAASMTAEEVTAVVESLPTWDLPDDFLVTASLGGVQSKVLLTQDRDGWAWPVRGAVSTHIIKPDPLESTIPDLLASEDWALKTASIAGLPAANAHLTDFGSRRAIVVERFDRSPDGTRLHQEDFTQALALTSAAKYEGSSTPPSRLTKLVDAASSHTRDETEFRRDLLRAVSFNVLIGNGDAHSKNYSLILRDGGEVQLAPLYDVAPTLLLYAPSNNAGHAIAGQIRLSYITLEHLVREGSAWGMDPDDARQTAAAALESVAAAAARIQAPEPLGFLQQLVPARAEDLLKGNAARRSL